MVPIVIMGSNRRQSKAAILVDRGKPIVVAHEDRHAVTGRVGWAGASDMMTVIEAPDGPHEKVRITRLTHLYRMMGNFVKLLRWELVECQVHGCTNFAGR